MSKFVVKAVERVTPSIVVLRLDAGTKFSFRPGQFVQVLLERGGKIVRRAYSIASSSGGNRVIELSIRVVEGGFASNYLAGLKEGDVLDVEGPFGHFTLQDEIGNGIIFIANGVGCAALKLMIEDAVRRKPAHDVWFFFGVRAESDLLYRDAFEAIAASSRNFHFVPVLSKSDKPGYEHGYVQDAFRKLVKPENQDVYICGLPEMVDETRALCSELGFPDGKVHFEKYA